MTPLYKFRYVWIKVTNREGRKLAAVARDELIQRLAREMEAAPADSDYGKAAAAKHASALQMFGPAPLHMTLIVKPLEPGFTVGVILTNVHGVTAGDAEITTQEMPEGYTAEQSQEWIKSDIGKTWSTGALTCQLSYAVATLNLD